MTQAALSYSIVRHSERKTKCRWCRAPVRQDESDLYCCPLAKPSPHCLWCGDDLSDTKSFCSPLCSTDYHADVALTLFAKTA